jgi:hypothetical protein
MRDPRPTPHHPLHSRLPVLRARIGRRRDRQRGLPLSLGLCLDEVGKSFGLRQVDLAVLKRPPGELAGLGSPQPLDRCQCRKHRIYDRTAAMALKFHHIFSSRARGSVKPEDQRLIKKVARLRVSKLAHSCSAGWRKLASDPLCCLMGGRPTDANDRNGCWWPTTRQGEDRVHRQVKKGAITGATWPAPSQIILSAT